MKTIWPALALAIIITGYFVWSNSAAPSVSVLLVDDCHRLAGEVSALHNAGGIVSSAHLATARACTVSFGQDWAANGGERAAQLRAEGALRVQ